MAGHTQFGQSFSGSNYFRPTEGVTSFSGLPEWRKEEPNRRLSSQVGDRQGGNYQTYDGGGRAKPGQDSSDSGDSDRNLGRARHGANSDSESDSDRKKWTKNPLVVRRIKRSDKLKQTEKRLSDTGSGIAAKNRDSFIYHSNEESATGTTGFGDRNANSKEGASTSKTTSKYQRLEEMRKRRLNLSVTSDEEGMPQTSPRSRFSAPWSRNLPASNTKKEPLPLSRQSHIVPEFAKTTQQPAPLRPFTFSTQNEQSSFTASSAANSFSPQRGFQLFTAKPASPLSTSYTGLNQQFPSSQRPDISKVPNQIQLQTLDQQPRVTGSYELGHQQQPRMFGSYETFQPQSQELSPRQPSYKIAKTSLSPATQPVSNTSELQFTTQAFVPSNFSAFDSSHQVNTNTRISAQPAATSQNFRNIQSRESPSLFLPTNVAPSSSREIVLQVRKPSDEDQMKSRHNIPIKIPLKSGTFVAEDSLDELVESNIQYLDSEVDKAKTKRQSNTNVAKFSSLPDQKKFSRTSAISKPQNQPSINVQASTSIQLHVSMPGDTQRGGPVKVEAMVQESPSFGNRFRFANENKMNSQPDVVPRKLLHDSNYGSTNDEFSPNRNVPKSDSLLDPHVFVPSKMGTFLQPETIGERKPISDNEGRLCAPRMDRGMFSDVEYDVGISQRVKKWEAYMKDKDELSSRGDNKNVHDNIDPKVMPNNVTKSDMQREPRSFNQLANISPTVQQQNYAASTRVIVHGSETIALPGEKTPGKFYQTEKDPGHYARSQNLIPNQVFNAPLSLRPEKTFTSSSELRQQMLTNRWQPTPGKISPGRITQEHQPTQISGYQEASLPSSRTLTKKLSDSTEAKEGDKRQSKYREELSEMSSMKTDSVVNLRRRFDTASTTSEDDQKSVSTASAKLVRPSKESRSQNDSTDWSKVLPGYHSKIRESDVWSPNLESTQGVSVSIERVTARTLQTIPFSEDPFWKEIEQITSFDPNTSGHLTASMVQETIIPAEPIQSLHCPVELKTPQSFTLPNQPRNHVTSISDRVQKAKSLYTPSIIPLNVQGNTQSSAAIALDKVLSDVHRSTMEGNELSPRKRSLEISSVSKISAPFNVSQTVRNQNNTMQTADSQFTLTKPSTDTQSNKVFYLDQLSHARSETMPVKLKQTTQINQYAKPQNRQSNIPQGLGNNYQLDPNLLTQKLLRTGLVVETDNDELVGRVQPQSSWLETSVANKRLTSSTVEPEKRFSFNNAVPDKRLTSGAIEQNKRFSFTSEEPYKNLTSTTREPLKPLPSSNTFQEKLLTFSNAIPNNQIPRNIITQDYRSVFNPAVPDKHSTISSNKSLLFEPIASDKSLVSNNLVSKENRVISTISPFYTVLNSQANNTAKLEKPFHQTTPPVSKQSGISSGTGISSASSWSANLPVTNSLASTWSAKQVGANIKTPWSAKQAGEDTLASPLSVKQSSLNTTTPWSAKQAGLNTSTPWSTKQAGENTLASPLSVKLSGANTLASPWSVKQANENTLTPPWSVKQRSANALDNIQKALAPFGPTSYQPDPETLYGTSRLQSFTEPDMRSFKKPGMDTSRGVNTSATGWSYYSNFDKDLQQSSPNESNLSDSSSRLEEVNKSMDDLKNLARDVEKRINVIKGKLGSADENSLDSILGSLKKVAPEVEKQETELASFQDYYATKKSKLSDALVELDRIYKNLQLNTDDLTPQPKQDNFNPSSSYVKNYGAINTQPKSVHLRPMQTRISSVYIGGLDSKNKHDAAGEKETEFDIISKSFQAIIDEVNQTTDLLSKAVERNKKSNMAPETQKQTFNITVYPGNNPEGSNPSAVSTTKANSDLQGDTGSRLIHKKGTSQNIHTHEPITSGLPETALDDIVDGGHVLQKDTGIVIVTARAETSSPASQQKTRVRPVKDNIIIQEDRAARKEGNENIWRTSPSPKSSPALSRKLLLSSGSDREIDLKQIAKVSSGKQAAETSTVQLQINLMNDPQNQDGKHITEFVIDSSQPPQIMNVGQVEPTSHKDSYIHNDPSLLSNYAPERDQPEIATQPVTQLSIGTDSSSSSVFQHSSSSASSASMNLTPPVSEGNQQIYKRSGSKTDDSETASSGELKAKKKIGTGVAMMLDKLTSGESKLVALKKRSETRSDPGLATFSRENREEIYRDTVHTHTENTRRNTDELCLKNQAASSNKQIPPLSTSRTVSIVSTLAKSFNSGPSSPQTFSPVDKPPLSPWKRHTSDPDKQSVTDAIKAGSPKSIPKIPRPVSLNGSPASEGYYTPKERESPLPRTTSPDVINMRPPVGKSSRGVSQGRPHSFHELISCFDKDPQKIQQKPRNTFRKYASAEGINSETMARQ